MSGLLYGAMVAGLARAREGGQVLVCNATAAGRQQARADYLALAGADFVAYGGSLFHPSGGIVEFWVPGEALPPHDRVAP